MITPSLSYNSFSNTLCKDAPPSKIIILPQQVFWIASNTLGVKGETAKNMLEGKDTPNMSIWIDYQGTGRYY